MTEIIFGLFVWRVDKEAENIRKHGVSFEEALKSFKDKKRLVMTDEAHSQKEQRYFCIGKVGNRIATVRFTYRAGKIRIFGAGYWRKGVKEYEKENQKK